jgi:4-carboxymuconolactone decarboxylase
LSPGQPKDVDPVSGFRLPLGKKEGLDDYGKKVYEQVFGPGGRSRVGARGPYGIRLYGPKVLELSYSLSDYLRYHSGLSGWVRELAILITAREMDNQFEWAAHEPQGLKDGLPQSTIDIVKYRRGLEGLPETEAVIIQLGRQMFGKKKVDSDTFARALKIFGPKQLVEWVTLMGLYSSTAALLNTFDMHWTRNRSSSSCPCLSPALSAPPDNLLPFDEGGLRGRQVIATVGVLANPHSSVFTSVTDLGEIQISQNKKPIEEIQD